MGVFDKFTGRKADGAAGVVTGTETAERKDQEAGTYMTESDSDSSLDLADRNEKDILAHPDEITLGALPGVQKAEAAALVWSQKAVYCLYAW